MKEDKLMKDIHSMSDTEWLQWQKEVIRDEYVKAVKG